MIAYIAKQNSKTFTNAKRKLDFEIEPLGLGFRLYITASYISDIGNAEITPTD